MPVGVVPAVVLLPQLNVSPCAAVVEPAGLGPLCRGVAFEPVDFAPLLVVLGSGSSSCCGAHDSVVQSSPRPILTTVNTGQAGAPDRVAVFIDESGQPSQSRKSSRHFVVGAAMVRSSRLPEAADWLATTRAAVNRRPGQELHWNKLKAHHRPIVSSALLEQPWGRFVTVIVCKDHLPPSPHLNDDRAYLYAMRFLCERVSWFARSHSLQVDLTIAHKIRFKHRKLGEYEARLRADRWCQIDWRYLSLVNARLDQPQRCEYLQIADLATSAVAAGFEPDAHGQTHPEYVRAFRARLWHPRNAALTSYGMKMHPWKNSTRAAYPWVAAL